MADLKEKKFGYVVQPPPPPPPGPHKPPFPPFLPPIPPAPIPHGMTVQDWMTYINSYIDVRARQLYDKLKSMVQQHSDDDVHNYILFRDQATGTVYKMFMLNGTVHTIEHVVDESGRSTAVINGQTIVWDDKTGNNVGNGSSGDSSTSSQTTP